MTAAETSDLAQGAAIGARPRWFSRRPGRLKVLAWQVGVFAAFLAAWQFLPMIEPLQERFNFFDPFYISSPDAVLTTVIDLALGRNNVSIWPYVGRTLEAAMIGVAIGMLAGTIVGLILSNYDFASRVAQPFITAVNSTPRIAFIPVIVIFFGPTRNAAITVSVLVVFFVAFFNAYEGGRTVPSQLVQNSRLLGANERRTMLWVRLPYVIAWCLAALPVAVSFSLLSVVTAEVMTGYEGVGRIVSNAQFTVDAALSMAVVVYLAAIGVVTVSAFNLIKQRILHWWDAG